MVRQADLVELLDTHTKSKFPNAKYQVPSFAGAGRGAPPSRTRLSRRASVSRYSASRDARPLAQPRRCAFSLEYSL